MNGHTHIHKILCVWIQNILPQSINVIKHCIHSHISKWIEPTVISKINCSETNTLPWLTEGQKENTTETLTSVPLSESRPRLQFMQNCGVLPNSKCKYKCGAPGAVDPLLCSTVQQYYFKISAAILVTEQIHKGPRKHIYPRFNTLVHTKLMINEEQ